MRKIIDLCKEVPLLPIVILAAIPLALIPSWRPWGHIPSAFDPGVGEWIVILLVAWTIITSIREMIKSLREGHVGVDLLAVVALASTVAVQQYWAAWAITLMVASGDAIESYAQSKARGNLTALIKAAPQQAHVVTLPGVTGADAATDSEGFRAVQQAIDDAQRTGETLSAGNGHFTTVPVDQVELGSVLLVLPGEIVPVDGTLLSGSATLDLSNINGEPVPRTVFSGAKVLSGAINGSTTMMIRSTSLAKDSQYQQILKLVQSAQDSRAAVVRTADMLAVPFTIISFLIAGIAWAVSGTPLRFAQVLVLATPCPLLIAAPVAYVAGTGRLAKASILIKAQDVLENLGRVTHVFFDKTGTLTKGVFSVAEARPAPGMTGEELIMLAALAESYSSHPISGSLREAAGEALDTARVSDVKEVAGGGVTALVDGRRVAAGNARLMESLSVAFTPDDAAGTIVYVAADGRFAGTIRINDQIKPTSKQAIQGLRSQGVRTVMLTGDAASVADAVGGQLGMDEIHSELLPADKVTQVERLLAAKNPRTTLAFVGDGINDAPVLSRADIGIAMGAMGSDAAIEAADIVLMDDDPAKISLAMRISRKCLRIVNQNIVFALGVKALCLILGAMGKAGMQAAIFADVGVMVLAVLNATRTLQVQEEA